MKQNKQMETFPFNTPKNLSEESKCLLAVTSFETTKSVDNITDETKNFSTSTQSFRCPEGGEELINKLKNYYSLDPKTISNYM